MISYLLHKPTEYSSHLFVSLSWVYYFRHLIGVLHARMDGTPIVSLTNFCSNNKNTNNLQRSKASYLLPEDYPFRSVKLERFPLYFFFSGCKAIKQAGSHSLPWEILDASNARCVCYNAGVDTTPRSLFMQHTAEAVMSTQYPDLQLRDAQLHPIYKYAYYVQLMLTQAWRVPILHGKLPQTPGLEATSKEKGTYAFFLLLLFKPHRDMNDLLDDIFGKHFRPLSVDAAYDAAYSYYQLWKAELLRASAIESNHQDVVLAAYPPFDTPTWWARLTLEKIKNYDIALRRHTVESARAPIDVLGLPEYNFIDNSECNGVSKDDDAVDCIDPGAAAAEESSDSGYRSDHDRDPLQKNHDANLRKRKSHTLDSLASHCGIMPTGCVLEDFHDPPVKIMSRNVEGKYWQDFALQEREAFARPCDEPELLVRNVSWEINTEDAVSAAVNQATFFKSVDSFHVDYELLQSSALGKEKKFDADLRKAVGALPAYVPSETVVMQAAFSLIQSGLLHIPDIGVVNVKQARAFLWNAAWLQEYMNLQWRECDRSFPASHTTPKFQNFQLALVGPGGTGKTAVLKITEALTTYFLGPDRVRKLAPTNAAARLLGGDTLHSLCKLPFGNARLSSKRGRLTSAALMRHRRRWNSAVAGYLDEVSMMPSDQLLQVDVRLRQAKAPEEPFGGLGMNMCGDFLQLPPVDKDGSKKSLAKPNAQHSSEDDDDADVQVKKDKTKKEKLAESQQGRHIWENVQRAVCLDINIRAPGLIGRLQEEMRQGSVSHEMYQVYLSRVLRPQDERLSMPPFSDNTVHFIVHRHRIRVMRSLTNAKFNSRLLHQPLYMVQAHDALVHEEDRHKFTDEVRKELLRYVNPQNTKGLPSFLPLYQGMRLALSSKDCVRFGVVKGCACVLRHIVFADDEILPDSLVAGHIHALRYIPASLILQAEGAQWTLPASELPQNLPAGLDRRGLFQLRPTHDYLRARYEGSYFSIRRTSLLVMPADTLTVYAAQGQTFEAVVADMQKPPSLESTKHWLACYVMLSRAKSLEGFCVLRPATRTELSHKPPQYLIDELDRLSRVENACLQELVDYILQLPIEKPTQVMHVLESSSGDDQRKMVAEMRGMRSIAPPQRVSTANKIASVSTVADDVSKQRATKPATSFANIAVVHSANTVVAGVAHTVTQAQCISNEDKLTQTSIVSAVFNANPTEEDVRPSHAFVDEHAASMLASSLHALVDTRTRPTCRPDQQCFINASITALFACPDVCKELTTIYQTCCNPAVETMPRSTLACLMTIARSPWDRRSEDVLAGSVEERLAITYQVALKDAALGKAFFPWLQWNSFYHNAQEDAQELLQAMLDVDSSPKLQSLFLGVNQPVLKCSNPFCLHSVPVTGADAFTCMKVEIVGQDSLQQAVDDYLNHLEPVQLKDWICLDCNSREQPLKQNVVTSYPRLLWVMLNRFRTHFREGVDSSASQEYLRHHVQCEEALQVHGVSYRQVARIYHSGHSLYGGHYFVVCRHTHDAGNWWYYNDNVRRLERPNDDHQDSSRVYMCFYERILDQ